MFWNFWATEFNVRSRGWLDMVAPACNFRVQEVKAGGGSRSKNLSQRTKTSKNLPKLTLFLDSNGIRSWGVLIFLLGFFVRALLKKTKHSGGRGRWISELEASLVYKVSSRTARATQRNPVLKNKTKQTKTKPKQQQKTK
jgi:membrane protein insertase Oxa1/YidC/SpoIIIJ